MYRFSIVIAVVSLLLAQSSAAQSPLKFKQIRDGVPKEPLSAAEFAELGDPLFKLLLKDNADKTKLSAILEKIQPDASKRKLFIVSEDIVSTSQPGQRRVVISFEGGINPQEGLAGNVMLSVFLDQARMADVQPVEAWGWDNLRGRYNYYKLDGPPSGAMSWKFRGSSVAADLMSAGERTNTCMRCHVSGAPVMKELHFPWNNWHAGPGGSFKADYLTASPPGPGKWPIAATLQGLATADKLEEDLILPALRRFNQSRVNAALKREDATGNRAVTPAGQMTVLAGRRLLRSLFETVEVNLISSRDTSGIHPRGTPAPLAGANIRIPRSFFLNADLIFGGGPAGLGGLGVATDPPQAVVTAEENKTLISSFNVRLGSIQGDTHFAWFVPEVSFIDDHLVDLMIKQGIVSAHVVAAAMSIDLEKPVFSAKRAGLMEFVPDQFNFTPIPQGADLSIPRDPTKDELAKAMIAAIDAKNPPAQSPADEFRALLKSPNAVSELQQRVKLFSDRIKSELESGDVQRRKVELERLFKCAIDRRRLMQAHPVLGNLKESPLLLAVPPSGQPAACP